MLLGTLGVEKKFNRRKMKWHFVKKPLEQIRKHLAERQRNLLGGRGSEGFT